MNPCLAIAPHTHTHRLFEAKCPRRWKVKYVAHASKLVCCMCVECLLKMKCVATYLVSSAQVLCIPIRVEIIVLKKRI